MFILVAMSNAVNLTDGLDGLATGTSAIIGIACCQLKTCEPIGAREQRQA